MDLGWTVALGLYVFGCALASMFIDPEDMWDVAQVFAWPLIATLHIAVVLVALAAVAVERWRFR